MKLKSPLAANFSPVPYESSLEAMIINEFGVGFKILHCICTSHYFLLLNIVYFEIYPYSTNSFRRKAFRRA